MSRRIVQYDDLDDVSNVQMKSPAAAAAGDVQSSSSRTASLPLQGQTSIWVADDSMADLSSGDLDVLAEQDPDDEEGPPHPDAHKKLSYAAKKRLRRKRREQEKRNAAGMSQNQGDQLQPTKKQRTTESVQNVTSVAPTSHDDEMREGNFPEEEGEGDDGGYAQGEDYEDEDDNGFGVWDGSFANGVLVPTLPETGGSANGKAQEQIQRPPAPSAVTDGGRVLSHEEVWSENALVDAWKAAQEEFARYHSQSAGIFSSVAVPAKQNASALWYDAPTPGSEQALKAQEVSEANKQIRRLRLYTQRNQEQQRRQEQYQEVKSAPYESDIESKRKKALQTIQLGSSVAGSRKVRVQEHETPSRAGWPNGKRRIPPSIGVPGNSAWQEACATVAATRNLVGVSERTTSVETRAQAFSAQIASAAAIQSEAASVSGVAPAQTIEEPADTAEEAATEKPSHLPTSSLASTGAQTGTTSSQQPPSESMPLRAHGLRAHTQNSYAAGTTDGNAIGTLPDVLSGDAEGNEAEIFQSICMSWYYAGYYTALWQKKWAGPQRQQGSSRS